MLTPRGHVCLMCTADVLLGHVWGDGYICFPCITKVHKGGEREAESVMYMNDARYRGHEILNYAGMPVTLDPTMDPAEGILNNGQQIRMHPGHINLLRAVDFTDNRSVGNRIAQIVVHIGEIFEFAAKAQREDDSMVEVILRDVNGTFLTLVRVNIGAQSGTFKLPESIPELLQDRMLDQLSRYVFVEWSS